MTIDQMIEKELKDAVSYAVNADYEHLEQDMKGYSHVFSDDFNEKMNSLVTIEKIRVHRRKIRFSILIAAIIIMIASSVVFANEVLREKIGNLIFNFYQDSVDIRSESLDSVEETEEFTPLPLKYVPKGFKLDEKEEDPFSVYYEYYSDKEGNVFYYLQSNTKETTISATYNGKCREKIEIEGDIIYYISDDKMNTILLERNNTIYQMISNKDKNFLIEIFNQNF